MLYFRSCPRCTTGTIQLDTDIYGTYISCLNCGFEKSAASVRKIKFNEQAADGVSPFAEVETVTAVADADDESEDDLYEDEDEDPLEEVAELRRAVG